MTSAKVLNKICPEFVYIRLHKTNPVPAGGGGEGVGGGGGCGVQHAPWVYLGHSLLTVDLYVPYTNCTRIVTVVYILRLSCTVHSVCYLNDKKSGEK